VTINTKVLIASIATAIILLPSVKGARATSFTNGSYTFQSLDPAPTGTGFGTYNVILFQNSNGGAGNDGGAVDVDDSNGALPTGSTTDSNSLFWMTSVAELRSYYNSQFGANKVTNIVLFLDVNETGQPQDLNLVTLNIYKNGTTTPNSLNPTGANDLSQADQQSITGQTGGTLLTQLASSPLTLAQVATGSGSDDWAIFTGINPYDSALDGATLLFNFRINVLNNGPEALTIRGDISNCDFPGQCPGDTSTTATQATSIPEPSTMFLLGSGLLVLARAARRKKS
jgi:hypothetical protein